MPQFACVDVIAYSETLKNCISGWLKYSADAASSADADATSGKCKQFYLVPWRGPTENHQFPELLNSI